MKVIKKNGLDYNITDELYESIMIHNPEILSEDEKMDKEYEQTVDKEIQQKFPNQESQERPYLKESDIKSILKDVIPRIMHNVRLQKKRKSLGMDEKVFRHKAANIVKKSLYKWDEDDLEYYNKNKTSKLKQFVSYVDDSLDDIKKYQQNKKQSKSKKQNEANDLDENLRRALNPTIDEINKCMKTAEIDDSVIQDIINHISNILNKRNLRGAFSVSRATDTSNIDWISGKAKGVFVKGLLSQPISAKIGNEMKECISPRLIANIGFGDIAKDIIMKYPNRHPDSDISENGLYYENDNFYTKEEVNKILTSIPSNEYDKRAIVVDLISGNVSDNMYAIHNDPKLLDNFNISYTRDITGVNEIELYKIILSSKKFKMPEVVIMITSKIGYWKAFFK